ncbi:MAG: hypothetical protein P4L33_06615 [Capsulimonadaceae bacterium]|nr:hypothetical protein [Capsulimonadaceae bacterium]
MSVQEGGVEKALESGNAQHGVRNAEVTRVALLAVLSYIAFSVGIPLISLPHVAGPWIGPAALLATLITTFVFMFLQLWVARSLVNVGTRALGAAIAVVASTLLWYLCFVLKTHEQLLRRLPEDPLMVMGVAGMGVTLTVGLSYLGIVLSRIIREPNVLLPVAFVAMPIDYLGAMTPTGYTADMVKHHPHAVQNVMVSVPHVQGLMPIGFIGPGDVLFVAFFLAVVQHLSLNERGTFRWMYILLTATMVVVAIAPIPINIAALVPMGLAVLIANFRHFKLQRSEVFASIYAAIIVIALAFGFYTYSHHHLFGGK